MKKDQLLKEQSKIFLRCHNIFDEKSCLTSDEDALFEFKDTGNSLNINPRLVALVHFRKHFNRFQNAILRNAPAPEDSIYDMINYLVIMKCLEEENADKK